MPTHRTRRAVLFACGTVWIAVGAPEGASRPDEVVPTTVPRQQAIVLRNTCERCRVDVSRLASLGDEGEGHLGEVDDVVRDGRGQYLVATSARRGEILVFSARGAFVRTLGRRGDGPGEFGFVVRLFRTGADTIHAFDLLQHRWTVLSPSRSVLRTAPYQGRFQFEAALLKDGGAVLNAYVGSAASAGIPLHLTDARGRVVRSFGAGTNEPVRYDVPSGYSRRLAVEGDTAVWAARINEYRVELWRLDGARLAEFVREPAPFQPWVESRLVAPNQPPQPLVRAIRRDAAGRLWILYHLASDRWQQALEQVRTGEGTHFVARNHDLLLDTVIEVVDPRRRAVIASQRIDTCLDGFADDGIAFSYSDADVRVHIWQLRIVSP